MPKATRWLRSRAALPLSSPKGAGQGRLSGCHSELAAAVQGGNRSQGRGGGGDWGLPSPPELWAGEPSGPEFPRQGLSPLLRP